MNTTQSIPPIQKPFVAGKDRPAAVAAKMFLPAAALPKSMRKSVSKVSMPSKAAKMVLGRKSDAC